MAAKPPVTKGLQELAAEYGWAWQVFKSNTDLMHTLKQAMSGQWSADQFSAHVMNTHWYRTTSAAAREWQILKAGDPATASTRLQARTVTIENTAGALGVKLTPAQLRLITSDSILFGWTDAQVQRAIGVDWKYNPNTVQSGLAASSLQAIRKTAADYLVPIADSTLQQWGSQILAGAATHDDFTAYAQKQAKSLFPTWQKEIDAGMTVKDLVNPYAQLAGQTLGLDPNSIDFTQSKWRSLIDTVDPKTKERQPLSLADTQVKLRSDPVYGYDTSMDGTQNASKLATSLAQAMGAQ